MMAAELTHVREAIAALRVEIEGAPDLSAIGGLSPLERGRRLHAVQAQRERLRVLSSSIAAIEDKQASERAVTQLRTLVRQMTADLQAQRAALVEEASPLYGGVRHSQLVRDIDGLDDALRCLRLGGADHTPTPIVRWLQDHGIEAPAGVDPWMAARLSSDEKLTTRIDELRSQIREFERRLAAAMPDAEAALS